MLPVLLIVFIVAASLFAFLALIAFLVPARKKSLKERKKLKRNRRVFLSFTLIFAVAAFCVHTAETGGFTSVSLKMNTDSPVTAYKNQQDYANLPDAVYAVGDDYYVHTGKDLLYGYAGTAETVTAEDGSSVRTVRYESGLLGKGLLKAAGSREFLAVIGKNGQLRLRGAYEYLTYLQNRTSYNGSVFDNGCTDVAATSNNLIYVSNGDLYTAGYNAFGQLGDGTERSRVESARILERVASVSVSETHVLAVDVFGNLYGFGDNNYSEMGNRTTAQCITPVKLLSGVKQACAGRFFSIVLTKSGEVYAAGRNDRGQLGTGDGREYATYTKVMEGIDKIAVCGDSCAALTAGGALYVWGANPNGQLAVSGATVPKPAQVSTEAYDVAMGETSMAVLTLNRDLLVSGTARGDGGGETLVPVWEFGATVSEQNLYRSVIAMPSREG